jgi:hypothetical protein
MGSGHRDRFMGRAGIALGLCSLGIASGCAQTVCEAAYGCGLSPAPDAAMCSGPGTACGSAIVDAGGSEADAAPALPSTLGRVSEPCPTGTSGELVDSGADAGSDASTVEASLSSSELDADATDEFTAGAHCMPEGSGCVRGMFVSPKGSDENDGTNPDFPMRTLQSALLRAKAAGVPVFACDDGRGFVEALTVDSSVDGIEVHGGYDCATWIPRSNGRTTLWSPATTAVKVIGLAAGVLFEGFELRGDNAKVGASSIAIAVQASKGVVFRNVRVIAGNGGEGLPGLSGSKGEDGPPTDTAQLGTRADCPGQFTRHAGGSWPSANLCGSRGGTGGEGRLGGPGTKGEAGSPQENVVNPRLDNGGRTDGDRLGVNGSDGLPGLGGMVAVRSGDFTESGYTPGAPGGAGSEGHPGQGGGGGGASDATGTPCTGASGSVGGIGGCGGTGGKGGLSGGASVALFSWESDVTLDGCELSAATGGTGGKGGDGGPGGTGGDGAGAPSGYWKIDSGVPVVYPGGQGGQGGNGGAGGPGAGGNGGPAYAVVFHGAQPIAVHGTTLLSGVGGRGGPGGLSGSVKGDNGRDGEASAQLAILP